MNAKHHLAVVAVIVTAIDAGSATAALIKAFGSSSNIKDYAFVKTPENTRAYPKVADVTKVEEARQLADAAEHSNLEEDEQLKFQFDYEFEFDNLIAENFPYLNGN